MASVFENWVSTIDHLTNWTFRNQRCFVARITNVRTARISAETKARLKIETPIRLSNIVFWISDSWLKGQHDMSTETSICHDTMPMYWPLVDPWGENPCGWLKDDVLSCLFLLFPLFFFFFFCISCNSIWKVNSSSLFSTVSNFLQNTQKKNKRVRTMLKSIRRSSVETGP